MKPSFCILLFFIITLSVSAQNVSNDYILYVRDAASFFETKDYTKAATSYSLAFKSNEGKAKPADKYNAARSWALANQPDSAFVQLYQLARNYNYKDIAQITNDPHLINLHNDNRFKPLLELINENKINAEKKLNKPLTAQLDSIFYDNQHYRSMVDAVEHQYGNDSKEVKNLWQTIRRKDSLNVVKVSTIIDKYGWLGADLVGEQGNSALALVIQHAGLPVQEKYLPVMSDAVKNGKASWEDLAFLMDKIEMKNGRPQIYGTQVLLENGHYIVYPIADEINVNHRRTVAGLQSLSVYLKKYKIDYIMPTK